MRRFFCSAGLFLFLLFFSAPSSLAKNPLRITLTMNGRDALHGWSREHPLTLRRSRVTINWSVQNMTKDPLRLSQAEITLSPLLPAQSVPLGFDLPPALNLTRSQSFDIPSWATMLGIRLPVSLSVMGADGRTLLRAETWIALGNPSPWEGLLGGGSIAVLILSLGLGAGALARAAGNQPSGDWQEQTFTHAGRFLRTLAGSALALGLFLWLVSSGTLLPEIFLLTPLYALLLFCSMMGALYKALLSLISRVIAR